MVNIKRFGLLADGRLITSDDELKTSLNPRISKKWDTC